MHARLFARCESNGRWLLLAGAEFFGVPDGSPKHFTIVFNAFVFCQVRSTPECSVKRAE